MYQVVDIVRIFFLIFFINAVNGEIQSQNNDLVEPIKCFQCNSATDPGCASLTKADKNSTYYKVCAENKRSLGKKPFCRKTMYTILNDEKLVRISRECGWEIYKTNLTKCYDVDTDFKYEVSCQCFTDGCNSASQISSWTLSRFMLVLTCFNLFLDIAKSYRFCLT